MRLIKPKFWDTKNFISLVLYPLSAITYLINITKKIFSHVPCYDQKVNSSVRTN